MKSSALQIAGKTLIYTLIALALAVFLLPLFWIIETSFKSYNDIFAIPPKFTNFGFTLDNYRHVFVTNTGALGNGQSVNVSTGFAHYFTNSIILAVASTAIALVLGTATAYAFSRFRIPGSNDI